MLITRKQNTGEITIIKNILRYFNVDTSFEHCKKNQDSIISTSTIEQINSIKKAMIEILKRNPENLTVENEVEKPKQLLRNLDFTNKTVEKSPYHPFIINKNVINFESSIWNSIAGEMAIEVKQSKFASIKAIRPKEIISSPKLDLPRMYNEINTVC